MYNADRTRERFIKEVERLLEAEVARSAAALAEGAGLHGYNISDLQTGRTKEVSLKVLSSFVTAYRKHGVTYEFILEGKNRQPEKLINTGKLLLHARRAKEEADEIIKALKE